MKESRLLASAWSATKSFIRNGRRLWRNDGVYMVAVRDVDMRPTKSASDREYQRAVRWLLNQKKTGRRTPTHIKNYILSNRHHLIQDPAFKTAGMVMPNRRHEVPS